MSDLRGQIEKIPTQALKTAASCTKHGERTYTCVNSGCKQVVTRKACETWHMDQCDDCIVHWAYDKAVRDADKAINDASPVGTNELIKWHQQNVERWRASMIERGLLKVGVIGDAPLPGAMVKR